MQVKIILQLIIVASLQAQEKLWNWESVKPGKYNVGFTIIKEWDQSRAYKKKFDSTGTLTPNRSRPMVMYIWYPADRGEKNQKVIYKDYLVALNRDLNIMPDSNQKKEAVLKFCNLMTQYGDSISTEYLLKLIQKETLAYQNAPHAQGSFPWILFGNGLTAPAYFYSSYAEFLASHGYVSVCYQSLPEKEDSNFEFTLRGVEPHIRDMEFIMGYMKRQPYVLYDHMGLVAWSVGGVAQALLQMRNGEADVMISLDGATGYEYGKNMLKESIFFSRKSFTIPYVHVTGGLEGRFKVPKNFEFYDSLNTQAYFVTLSQLNHADFLSQTRFISGQSEQKKQSLENLHGFMLDFLNAYLKSDHVSFQKIIRKKNDALFDLKFKQ